MHRRKSRGQIPGFLPTMLKPAVPQGETLGSEAIGANKTATPALHGGFCLKSSLEVDTNWWICQHSISLMCGFHTLSWVTGGSTSITYWGTLALFLLQADPLFNTLLLLEHAPAPQQARTTCNLV